MFVLNKKNSSCKSLFFCFVYVNFNFFSVKSLLLLTLAAVEYSESGENDHQK